MTPEQCSEFDSAAQWCARRGYTGLTGSPLPEALSDAVGEQIDANPEVFARRVRHFGQKGPALRVVPAAKPKAEPKKARVKLPPWVKLPRWRLDLDAVWRSETHMKRLATLPVERDLLRHGPVEILSYPGGLAGLASTPAGARLLKTIQKGVY